MQQWRGLVEYMLVSCSIIYVRAYEENCDYLDLTKSDHTNYLQCHNGCCGQFKDRHCCTGPIVIVGAVFGSVVGTLLVVVLIAVCYNAFKNKKQRHQTIPIITAEEYNDIPLPSPPIPAPSPYRNSKLRPPPFTTMPLRGTAKTPQSLRTATNTPQPFRTLTNAPQPFRNSSAFDGEVHPPPSMLHPPRLHVMPVSSDLKRSLSTSRFREKSDSTDM